MRPGHRAPPHPRLEAARREAGSSPERFASAGSGQLLGWRTASRWPAPDVGRCIHPFGRGSGSRCLRIASASQRRAERRRRRGGGAREERPPPNARWKGRGGPLSPSGCEARSPLGPASGEYLAAASGRVSGAEAVVAGSLEPAWLKGSLHDVARYELAVAFTGHAKKIEKGRKNSWLSQPESEYGPPFRPVDNFAEAG